MKQYLMLCDERGMEILRSVFQNIQFLEVQGMNMSPANQFNLLVTPIIPPVPQADVGVEQPVQQEALK